MNKKLTLDEVQRLTYGLNETSTQTYGIPIEQMTAQLESIEVWLQRNKKSKKVVAVRKLRSTIANRLRKLKAEQKLLSELHKGFTHGMCPTCRDSGIMGTIVMCTLPGSGEMSRLKCPTCKGTGEAPDEE